MQDDTTDNAPAAAPAPATPAAAGAAPAAATPAAPAAADKKKIAIKPPSRKPSGKNPVTPEVEAVVAEFVKNLLATGVDGLRKEFAELKTFIAPEFKYETFTANGAKNRYKDVVCLDATRVVLKLNVPPECDYIHANWVKMEGLSEKTTVIATQGPLESTIPDFWRMVHQEGATCILMLCKVVEDGKPKCAQYWPVEQGSFKNYGSMFVNNKKVEEDNKFITTTLEVLPDGCSNSTIVKLTQMSDWPDRGVPSSGLSILRMIRLIVPGGPCVLHCSAGIGRTGTVIAIDTAIQRLWKGQNVKMREVMQQLRIQRASAIQTESQYVFVHSTVLDYIRAKLPEKYREVAIRFHEEIKKAAMV